MTAVDALIDFDLGALRALVDSERLRWARAPRAHGEAALELATAELWCEVAGGVRDVDPERAAQLERRALEARRAALVVQLCAARSLSAELSGDRDRAVEMARRASRMARTEGLPEAEFLAHLVLARARRSKHLPHLAVRVLCALAEVATTAFQPWIALELFLAGASPSDIQALLPEVERGRSPARRAVRALFALSELTRHGDRGRFGSMKQELLDALSGFAPLRNDYAELLDALDSRAEVGARRPELAAWCYGGTDIAPPTVHGLCVRAESESGVDDLAECYVVAGPAVTPRRILGLGATLVDVPNVVRLRRTRRKQGRVECMAAVLGLAGPAGLSTECAFERAYGFAYVDEVHRGVVDVLMQRVRAYLGDGAELLRSQGRVWLEVRRPLLIPDPRSAPRAYDRLLRLLAREGSARAVDAARESGLSVRAAQNALKELIDAGLCTQRKEGRQILYAVEDTTFSEPTRKLRRQTVAARIEPER